MGRGEEETCVTVLRGEVPGFIGGPAKSAASLLARVGSAARGSFRAWRAGRAVRATAAAGDDIFAVAREGGRHAGFLRNYAGKSADELQSAIRSMQGNIADHAKWLKNPRLKAGNWDSFSATHQQNLLHHWKQDMVRAQEQIEILIRLLPQ